jgi:hypothetical protein
VLDDLVMLATRHLKKGDKIRLTGLGTGNCPQAPLVYVRL